MMKVKPRAGLKIRDPERHDHIEPSGRNVPQSQYWLRRLQDGDVTLVTDDAADYVVLEEKLEAQIVTKAKAKKANPEISVGDAIE